MTTFQILAIVAVVVAVGVTYLPKLKMNSAALLKHLPMVLVLGLAVVAFLPAPAPKTGPVAEVMRAATRADKQKLAAIYRTIGQITSEQGGKLLPTVGVWRAFHANSLRFAAAELKGKYAHLDTAVEQVLAQGFGLEDVALTPEMTSKIVAACKAVETQSE